MPLIIFINHPAECYQSTRPNSFPTIDMIRGTWLRSLRPLRSSRSLEEEHTFVFSYSQRINQRFFGKDETASVHKTI